MRKYEYAASILILIFAAIFVPILSAQSATPAVPKAQASAQSSKIPDLSGDEANSRFDARPVPARGVAAPRTIVVTYLVSCSSYVPLLTSGKNTRHVIVHNRSMLYNIFLEPGR